jgi:hypothetical protein
LSKKKKENIKDWRINKLGCEGGVDDLKVF